MLAKDTFSGAMLKLFRWYDDVVVNGFNHHIDLGAVGLYTRLFPSHDNGTESY